MKFEGEKIKKILLLPFLILLFLPEVIKPTAQDVVSDTVLDKEKDSLLVKIQTAKSDSERASIYLSLAKLYADINPNKAEKYLSEVKALTHGDSLNPIYIRYLNNMGIKSMTTGNYDTASFYYIRALNLAEKQRDKELVKDILNNLAIANIKIGSFKEGIRYFKRIYEIAKEGDDKEEISRTLLNLSLAYAQKGRLSEAETNLIRLFNTTENKFYKAVAANSLSYVYNATRKYQSAARFGKIALDLTRDTDNLQLQLEAMTNYSNALRMLKRYRKSDRIMRQVLELARKNNLKEQYANALGNLSLLYKDKKNYAKALEYHQRFTVLKDSLLNERVTEQLHELQIKYETEKKDKALAFKDAALERKNLIIRYTLIIAFILVISSAITLIMYRKNKKAYLELIRMHVDSLQKEEALDKKAKKGKAKPSDEKGKEETSEPLYEILEAKMNEEKLFLQSDLTLEKLAVELNVSSKHLSQVIHKKYDTNFPDFVNNFRVKEVSRLLLIPEYDNYSLEGIAQLCGFKSRSVFNQAFKKFMGVTPSFYRQSAKRFLKKADEIEETVQSKPVNSLKISQGKIT